MHFGPMVYLKFDAGQFWVFLLRKSTKNFREIDLVGAGGGCLWESCSSRRRTLSRFERGDASSKRAHAGGPGGSPGHPGTGEHASWRGGGSPRWQPSSAGRRRRCPGAQRGTAERCRGFARAIERQLGASDGGARGARTRSPCWQPSNAGRRRRCPRSTAERCRGFHGRAIERQLGARDGGAREARTL